MTDLIPSGAPQIAAGQADKVNGTKMVSVGCKLPNGLLCELGKVGDNDYTVVRLKGSNDALVVGGFGITENVSESFWNAWVKKHRGMAFIRNQLVFAMPDAASARDYAQDHATKKSGFEALDAMAGANDANGNKIITPDTNHLAQGRRDVAQAFQRSRQE